MSVQPGDVVDIDIERVAHQGVFVARHEGQVLFIPDALPGERVRVRVTESKKAFARGEVLEVLDASAARVEHPWKEARLDRAPEDRAGGADFGHIELGEQRTLKAAVLEESFERFAKSAVSWNVGAIGDDDETGGLHTRTRVTLHTDSDGNVGPYAARSHRVIAVDSLPLATERVDEMRPVSWRDARTGATIEVVEDGDGEVHVVPTGRGAAHHPLTIRQFVGDREFELDARGFWQTHRAAASVLSEALARQLDIERIRPNAEVLDLYGGVGLFASVLAERSIAAGSDARKLPITTVESVGDASAFARHNLGAYPEALAVTARVDLYLEDRLRRADGGERSRMQDATIVLDPPRAGAGARVIAALDAWNPQQIAYVACDPVALARDAGQLAERGWRMSSHDAFDLFPNTHHIEAIAVFERDR